MKSDRHHLPLIHSIKAKLILFYSLAVFTLLLLAAIFLYWGSITLLYKTDYEFLSDEIETIEYIMKGQPTDKEALKKAVIESPENHFNTIYRYYIRIYDNKNQVVMQTPGMDNILDDDKRYTNLREAPGKVRYHWYNHTNTEYLLAHSTIRIGKGIKNGSVVVMLDVNAQHNILHDRSKIFAGLLAATIISLLFGVWIANRGLKSLYLLTNTVEQITAQSLNQRIDPSSWPVELTGLGIAFNQMLDRMENSFTKLKQFSADLSHELRTPINNLIGETEVALSYSNSISELRGVMESNLEELHHISSMIESILFLSKAENPRQEISKTILSLHHEASTVCEYYQALSEEKNIKITVLGDAPLYANGEMIRRVMSNVIANALKYTPNHGNITITITHENDISMIEIKDSGIGIDKTHLPHLFDRFYRTSSAREQDEGGCGLGLSIVKSIIEIHHGSITIHSERNKGTVVTIKLPNAEHIA